MSCHPRVTEWTDTIQTRLPHVRKPQAPVRALGSLGRVLARSGALTAVRAFLAPGLGRKAHTVRPQWRAFVNYACDWEPLPDDGLERFPEGKPR